MRNEFYSAALNASMIFVHRTRRALAALDAMEVNDSIVVTKPIEGRE